MEKVESHSNILSIPPETDSILLESNKKIFVSEPIMKETPTGKKFGIRIKEVSYEQQLTELPASPTLTNVVQSGMDVDDGQVLESRASIWDYINKEPSQKERIPMRRNFQGQVAKKMPTLNMTQSYYSVSMQNPLRRNDFPSFYMKHRFSSIVSGGAIDGLSRLPLEGQNEPLSKLSGTQNDEEKIRKSQKRQHETSGTNTKRAKSNNDNIHDKEESIAIMAETASSPTPSTNGSEETIKFMAPSSSIPSTSSAGISSPKVSKAMPSLISLNPEDMARLRLETENNSNVHQLNSVQCDPLPTLIKKEPNWNSTRLLLKQMIASRSTVNTVHQNTPLIIDLTKDNDLECDNSHVEEKTQSAALPSVKKNEPLKKCGVCEECTRLDKSFSGQPKVSAFTQHQSKKDVQQMEGFPLASSLPLVNKTSGRSNESMKMPMSFVPQSQNYDTNRIHTETRAQSSALDNNSENYVVPLVNTSKLNEEQKKSLITNFGIESFIPVQGLVNMGIPVFKLLPSKTMQCSSLRVGPVHAFPQNPNKNMNNSTSFPISSINHQNFSNGQTNSFTNNGVTTHVSQPSIIIPLTRQAKPITAFPCTSANCNILTLRPPLLRYGVQQSQTQNAAVLNTYMTNNSVSSLQQNEVLSRYEQNMFQRIPKN